MCSTYFTIIADSKMNYCKISIITHIFRKEKTTESSQSDLNYFLPGSYILSGRNTAWSAAFPLNKQSNHQA